MSAGGSGLTYDAATDTYTYAWKTSKGWANTGDHASFADFSDPDGNTWNLQERGYRAV